MAAATAAGVAAPILWPTVIVGMIQVFSVQEIDYRAAGEKGAKQKRQEYSFHSYSL